MSADWKAGDRAVCIRCDWDRENFINEGEPRLGVAYLVTDVNQGTLINGQRSIGLELSGVASFRAKKQLLFFRKKIALAYWDSRAFRKIVPACDRISQRAEESC